MVLGEVVSEIRRHAEKYPYIIALDGTIGSRKNYDGERLHEALSPGAELVSMDLFVCVPRSLCDRKIGEGHIRLRDWYDIDKVRDTLSSVRENKIYSISGLYNIESGEIDKQITIDAERCRYLILEGLFSFDEELDGLIDLRVFVDTPSDVALARAEARDEAKRQLDHYG
ncbi:MAG: hypothetical protein ACHQ6U_06400 [Thermodesulfobacteriota bacterium]